MDCIVHGVTQSQTQLSDFDFTSHHLQLVDSVELQIWIQIEGSSHKEDINMNMNMPNKWASKYIK